MSETPLVQIRLVGDAFAVGHGLGAQAKRAIHDVVLTLDDFGFVEPWRGSNFARGLFEAARQAYPRYLRELEGMAAGAEVDLDTLFLWNCRGDLPLPSEARAGEQAGLRSALESMGEGCTTLLIPSEKGGGTIAHNEDGPAPLAGHCFLAAVESDGGSAFTSFCYPGMLPGHTCAVSNRGLVQTINHIRTRDPKVGVPRHFVCRAVLDSVGLDEAVAVLGRDDRAGGFHHSLAMAGDTRLLSVEAPGQACHVEEVRRPTAHANHLLAAAFEGLPQIVTASSARRQERADEMLAGRGGDLEDPTEILFDRTDGALPILRRGDGGDDGYTLGTAVFEIGLRQIAWRVRGDRESGFNHQGTAGAETS